MADLPPPPVPADCDLTDFSWFKLHYRRLERSAWWLNASDLARSRNVDLWVAAFQEVPSGSLPDDDATLARYAGFGRDLEGFRAVKGELLAPWRLCADGRWYHPTLCEVALEGWDALTDRRRQGRERMARLRARTRGEEVTPQSRVTPPDVTRHTEVEERREEDRTLFLVPDEPEPGRGWKGDEPFGFAWEACTSKMRQRSYSRERTWPLWRKAAEKAGGGERLLAALHAYLAGDADLERTGGPALHRWLSGGMWEHWLPAEPGASGAAPDPLADWRDLVREYRANGYWPADRGPKPGKPGCRCPAQLLTDLTPMARQKETQP